MSKSVRLKRWEPMLVEAEQLGWSVARYAKERGVAKSCLNAKQMFPRLASGALQTDHYSR